MWKSSWVFFSFEMQEQECLATNLRRQKKHAEGKREKQRKKLIEREIKRNIFSDRLTTRRESHLEG